MAEEKQSIDGILSELSDHLPQLRRQDIRDRLIVWINDLLLNDFSRLVSLLYRVDVSEQKLKNLLQQNTQTDAAVLIADLLIERQLEKIKWRNAFKGNNGIPDDDRW